MAEVAQADIEALLTNKVVELSNLEYKRDLPTTDDQRREIVYDILSLANTRGGDLIFGVEAERDTNNKPTGAPAKILGVESLNLDDLKLRLLQTVENCTRPRVEGIDFVAVGSFERGPAVIIRVPGSWNRPHMLQIEKSQRFYARTSAGRYLMDVDQIRSAMLASASLPEALDVLRRDRTSLIAANAGAVPLAPGAQMIFHIVPFSSLTQTLRLAPEQLKSLPMASISMVGGGNLRINFDGYLMTSTTRENVPIGYVQAFRSGVIESVISRLTDGNPPVIASGWYEKALINAIRPALQTLPALQIAPPYYVAITLAGVRGALLATSNYHREGPIDRDILFLPEVQIDKATLTVQELATALRPALDVVWQAAGALRSFNFDDQGKWSDR